MPVFVKKYTVSYRDMGCGAGAKWVCLQGRLAEERIKYNENNIN